MGFESISVHNRNFKEEIILERPKKGRNKNKNRIQMWITNMWSRKKIKNSPTYSH